MNAFQVPIHVVTIPNRLKQPPLITVPELIDNKRVYVQCSRGSGSTASESGRTSKVGPAAIGAAEHVLFHHRIGQHCAFQISAGHRHLRTLSAQTGSTIRPIASNHLIAPLPFSYIEAYEEMHLHHEGSTKARQIKRFRRRLS